jgi:hypothetical protein
VRSGAPLLARGWDTGGAGTPAGRPVGPDSARLLLRIAMPHLQGPGLMVCHGRTHPRRDRGASAFAQPESLDGPRRHDRSPTIASRAGRRSRRRSWPQAATTLVLALPSGLLVSDNTDDEIAIAIVAAFVLER